MASCCSVSFSISHSVSVSRSLSLFHTMLSGVCAEEHMCLLISAVNVSGNPINGPTIQLSPPKNFQTQCMCDPHGDIGNNRVAFQQLPPHQTAHVLVGMQMSELMPSMAMRVQISYMADGANKSLSVQLPINIADLLRPVPFSTDDFRCQSTELLLT